MKWNIFLCILAMTFSTMAQQATTPFTVDVTGEGKIKVSPDQALIKVRVEHQGKEASTVKAQNDEVIDAVIRFLRDEGIADTDVQTEYINLNKNYNYNSKTYNYQANQALSIHLNDLSKYEQIMSGLISSGINRIDGIQFKSSKMSSLQDEARVKAMENARHRATTYAQAIGQSIGKAISISEQGESYPQPKLLAGRAMAMEAASDALGETIAPGELTISMQVSVRFLLNQ